MLPAAVLNRPMFVMRNWCEMRIIPADDTISELEAQAREYDHAAEDQFQPSVTSLKELATICRDWAAALKSRRWIS